MASGNPYSRMIDKMRNAGKYYNGFDLEKANVVSVKPLQINYNNVVVPVGYSQNPIDLDQRHKKAIENDDGISDGLKQYLMDLYESFYLNAGDTVFVQRVGDTFYIVGKAV